MLYMVTFTINIPPMLAYIRYMDPMGYSKPPNQKYPGWYHEFRTGFPGVRLFNSFLWLAMHTCHQSNMYIYMYNV